MTGAAHHSCCPSARLALHARQLPSHGRDVYRWYVGRGCDTVVIYCPWCGANLEVERRARRASFKPIELRPAPPPPPKDRP